MYLLDTDTLIYSLKGNEEVCSRLRDHLSDTLKISIVTVMELYYGAYKSQKQESNIAKIKTLESAFEIVPLATESAEIFGMCKSKLEKAGTALDDFDLLIAASALSNNLTLVSNNEKHFKRIQGLKLENWTKAP